jgi:hypothetical protein
MKREQPDEFKIWYDYMNHLQAVPEGLERGEIYEALKERTPYIARRNATYRVFQESGINLLLDQLIVIQHDEALELLEEEANDGTL